MEELYAYMRTLLESTPMEFTRYAYDDMPWGSRMAALVGPRGVGKTTLLLQRIKREHDLSDTLYVTADHLYFAGHSLYETAESFVRNGGRHLFIDEVHKYANWSRELKNIFDAFPGLQVVFTGSSVLDITKGDVDLSRRAPAHEMQGLSFREFLAIRHGVSLEPFSLDEICSNKASIPGVEHPLPLFREYLRNGYYPFGTDPDFPVELERVVNRTLESDIPQYANMTVTTSRKLKRLMSIVSSTPPFKPNMTKLASQVGTTRQLVENYLVYMEKAGLVALLRTGAGGLGALGKPDKVYLDNTNLLYLLSGDGADAGAARKIFFFNQMRVRHEVTTSAVSDFEVEGRTFEVGGPGKTGKQVKGIGDAIVVKDGIEYGYGKTVPLWAFGLGY